jgi:hypothetical protein
MYNFEYYQYIKGVVVAIRYVTAKNRYDAVSILSDKYKGVFLLKCAELLNVTI